MNQPLVHTVDEACEVLHISRGSIYSLINRRQLKTFKIGGRRMVAHEDLVTFINEQREAA